MTSELIVVSPELPLRDAVEMLAREHLSGAPVVTAGRLVGVVTLSDIASFLSDVAPVPSIDEEAAEWEGDFPPATAAGEAEAAGAYFQELWADAGADLVERAQATGSPEWDVLGEHTVEEAMSRRIWSVHPDEPVEQAARLMHQKDVHRLLVVSNGRLNGLITTADITRAVAEGRLHDVS
jgi:CBS domain-containing protein